MDIPAAQSPGSRRFRFFRSVSALILREMATSYGRSPGGYLWAILEPVAMVALLSFIFSLLVRSPSLGTNFPLFYASGYLPFILYSVINQNVSGAIRYSKPLLAYPAVTCMDALLARLILHLTTQILVIFIVITGVVMIYNLTLILTWPAIFNAIGMVLVLSFGIGVLNCYLISRFDLWQRVWSILTRPLFLVSAVLFIPEDVPGIYREILMYNPLAHVTSEFRRGIYVTYDAVYVDPLYVYMIGVVTAFVGTVLLLRYYRDILQL